MPPENPIFSSTFNRIGVEIIKHRIFPRAEETTVRPGIFLPGTGGRLHGRPGCKAWVTVENRAHMLPTLQHPGSARGPSVHRGPPR